ncbi:hypothetical protein [Halomonas sp.]|uniref:hypothetical protein n=1 Tax=Halomonas sp. TaxID=1486246 RepID=UPI00257CDE3A|nr:hypothetical protein [Halomonas sp.]MCJ8285976.1 hypothetical protein [Halomonas sp.]NQY71029.1 hypothetical protein [Halomonas sp.]
MNYRLMFQLTDSLNTKSLEPLLLKPTPLEMPEHQIDSLQEVPATDDLIELPFTAEEGEKTSLVFVQGRVVSTKKTFTISDGGEIARCLVTCFIEPNRVVQQGTGELILEPTINNIEEML